MLNDQEIDALVSSHSLIRNYDPARLEAASYDLAIGTIFRNEKIINDSHVQSSEPVILEPGEVVTMLTLEELNLPDNICGTAYAMNAQSSEGLLVLNPGHVDPGYKGPLRVVAMNLRKVPLALQLGDRIFTVVFSRLQAPSSRPYSAAAKSRDALERAVNKTVVEKSIGSLSKLLSLSEGDINTLIRNHWSTVVVLLATVIGAIAAVIAAIYAFLAVLPTKETPTTRVERSADAKLSPVTSTSAGSSSVETPKVSPSASAASGRIRK